MLVKLVYAVYVCLWCIELLLTTINRHEPPCTMMLSCPLSLTGALAQASDHSETKEPRYKKTDV
jgi:hypothetical protein